MHHYKILLVINRSFQITEFMAKKKKRKIPVKQHSRKKPTGGKTIVKQHYRVISSRSFRLNAPRINISSALPRIRTNIKLNKNVVDNSLIINRLGTIVSYQGEEVIKIPHPNRYLLEAKLKYWNHHPLRENILEYSGFEPQAFQETIRKGFYDEIGFSSKLDYSDLLIKAVDEVLSDTERANLMEIKTFSKTLLDDDKISISEAIKIADKNEMRRLELVEQFKQYWMEWGARKPSAGYGTSGW